MRIRVLESLHGVAHLLLGLLVKLFSLLQLPQHFRCIIFFHVSLVNHLAFVSEDVATTLKDLAWSQELVLKVSCPICSNVSQLRVYVDVVCV